jgi:hypothetical protein
MRRPSCARVLRCSTAICRGGTSAARAFRPARYSLALRRCSSLLGSWWNRQYAPSPLGPDRLLRHQAVAERLRHDARSGLNNVRFHRPGTCPGKIYRVCPTSAGTLANAASLTPKFLASTSAQQISTAITSAPFAAISTAIARPMPRAAPVTTATFRKANSRAQHEPVWRSCQARFRNRLPIENPRFDIGLCLGYRRRRNGGSCRGGCNDEGPPNRIVVAHMILIS